MKKTQAPKVLLIILLLVAGSLLIVASGTKLGDILIPAAQADGNGSGANPPSSDLDPLPENPTPNNPDLPGSNTPTEPLPDDPTPEIPSGPAFPVAPSPSDRYAYTQAIAGELCGSVYTAVGYYIAVREDDTLYLYRMTEDGTLTARVALGDRKFLTVALTAEGIGILTGGESDCILHLVDPLELTVAILPLPKGNTGRFYALMDGFLLQIDSMLYLIRGGAIAESTTLPSADTVELFQVGNGYTVLSNTIAGFEVSLFDLNLKRYASMTVSNRRALGFCPVPSATGVNYAVLETENDMLYLTLYSPSFHTSTATSAGLGRGTSGSLHSNAQGLFVLVDGDDKRMYLSDFNLNFSLGERTPFAGVSALHGVEQYNGGYLALLEKDGALQLLDVRDDGTSALRTLDEDVSAVTFHRTTDGITLISNHDGVHIVHIDLNA